MKTQPKSRMPELALPFGIVGAAAGWLSARFLANPIVHVTVSGSAWIAVASAGIVGAAQGFALSRWCASRQTASSSAIWRRVLLAVVGAGVIAGAISVAIETGGTELLSGALEGAVCSLAFFPVCLLVVNAARRAERARNGSLVANADRREVWGILAASLSAVTLLALAEWPAARLHLAPSAEPARWIVLACAAATMAFLLADLRAYFVVRGLGRERLEHRENDLGEDGGVERVDLGLGADVLARVTTEGVAYRSRARAEMLLIGSATDAKDALRRALLRGAVGGVLIFGAFGLHRYAASDHGLIEFLRYRCDGGLASACAEEADLLEKNGNESADIVRAKACEMNDARSCRAYAEMIERGQLEEPFPNKTAAEHGCELGDAVSCHLYALDRARHGFFDRALSPMQSACDWGDKTACPDVHVVRAGLVPDVRARVVDCLRGRGDLCASASRADGISPESKAELDRRACALGARASCTGTGR